MPHQNHDLPDKKSLIDLMRKHGDSLLIPCPTSEDLILFCDEPHMLSGHAMIEIDKHLAICLDCQDKVEWTIQD